MADEKEYQDIINKRRQIRANERAYRRNYNKEKNQMTLKEQLASVLPQNMLPGNVGDVNKVTWPFWYVASFNFGIDPTYGTGTRVTQSFQVSQEAGLLLMAIGRKAWDNTIAGDLAPLQLEIRDRQSSRQFNDRPMPLQNLGKKSRPTILPTPLLIAPNAFMDMTMTSFSPDDMPTVGNGKHELYFFGYRVRLEDMNKNLGMIFG